MNKLTYLISLRTKNEGIIILKFPPRMNWCNTKRINLHSSIWGGVIPITIEYYTTQSNHFRKLDFQYLFYVAVVDIVTGRRWNTSIICCLRMTFPCECISSRTKFRIWFDHIVWSLHKFAYPIIEHKTSGQTIIHL